MSINMEEFRRAVEDLTYEERCALLAAIRYIRGDEDALDEVPEYMRQYLIR